MGRAGGKKPRSEEERRTWRSFLDPRTIARDGLPLQGCVATHHPSQRLLLVGDEHGRVHVFGAPGASCVFEPSSHSEVEEIQCSANASWIVAKLRDGSLTFWRLDGGMQPLLVEDDESREKATAIAVVAGVDVCWMGGSEGTLKAFQVGREQVELLPYRLLMEEVVDGLAQCESSDIDVNILNLLPQPRAERRRILVVLAELIVLCDVWDKKPVAYARECTMQASTVDGEGEGTSGVDFLDDPLSLAEDPVTCSCWMGMGGVGFVTGHRSGDVRLWKLPEAAHPQPLRSCPPEPYGIQCMARFQVDSKRGGGHRSCVRSVWYSGGPSEALLVLGGGVHGFPDIISRIPMTELGTGQPSSVQNLPWMGPILSSCLVYPPSHAREGEASHAIVLTDEGQIYVHKNLHAGEPVPTERFCPDIQHWDITCLKQVSITCGKMGSSNFYEPTSTSLPRHRSHPINGGSRSKPNLARQATALFTGHVDGEVRVWDSRSSQLSLLHTLSFMTEESREMASSRPSPVTCLSVCSISGICAAGSESGEVAVFCWSGKGKKQTKVQCLFGPGHRDMCTPIQAAGFRCILRLRNHCHSVTCLEISSALGYAAVGDSSGMVSLLNLKQCNILWQMRYFNCKVRSICFCRFSLLEDQRVLVVLAEDSTCITLNMENGEALGSSLFPKSASTAVGAFLLDEAGFPCTDKGEYLPLPWLTRGAPAQGSVEGEDQKHGLVGSRSGMSSPKNDPCTSQTDTSLQDSRLTQAIGEKVPNSTSAIKALMEYYKDQPESEVESEGCASSSQSSQCGTEQDDHLICKDDSDADSVGTAHRRPAFAVIATEEHIRVYSMKNLLSGDRTTVAKIAATSPLAYIAPFELSMDGAEPESPIQCQGKCVGCLLTITTSQDLTIYALPGLEAILERSLPSCLDWDKFREDLSPAILDFSCIPSLGEICLLREGGEVIRMSLPVDYHDDLEMDPPKLYDYIVEEAANMADLALRNEECSSHQMKAESAVSRPQEEGKKRVAVNEFFSKAAKTVAEGALDVGQKVGGLGADVGSLLKIGKRRGSASTLFEPKELAHPSTSEFMNFLGTFTESEVLDLSGWSILSDSDGLEAPIETKASTQKEQASSKAAERNFEGATRSTSGGKKIAPHMRTASEIRRKYGYSDNKLKSSLEDTRQKMVERGERLEQMSRKATEMEDGARGFADLAKQLANEESNKKWWQL